jgi:hypothetical protein
VVLVEVGPAEIYYRGEGIALGWPQDQLESLYRGSIVSNDDDVLETSQFG